MRAAAILFVFICCNSALGQGWVDDMKKCMPKTENRSSIRKYTPTKSWVNLYSDSTSVIEKIIQSYFFQAKTVRKIKLEQSSLLDYLSLEAMRKMFTNKKVKKKSHFFKQKRLMRILNSADVNYSLLDYVSFELPLVRSSNTFFYDELNGDSPYHLYKGERPSKEEIENGTAKFEPCGIHTEISIARIIEQKLRSSSIGKLLRSMQVETFGMAIIPKGITLHKKAIPKLKVFVIVGVKNIHLSKLDTKKTKRLKKKAVKEAEKEIQRYLKTLK